MKWTDHDGGARDLWRADLPADQLGVAWLGQGGFAIRAAGRRLVIDPYLSDYLAQKYRDREFSHVRLMPIPIEPRELTDLNWVFCSHSHTDHMDPGTLPLLASGNPACRFVVPRAVVDSALAAGVSADRLLPVNAGDDLELCGRVSMRVVASAHEQLQTNSRGEHHFLGFILRIGGFTLYHSGDCVVYDGLARMLRDQHIDLALLPVNSRDEFRRNRGIIGNMDMQEAIQLCADAGIRWLVPHHFGLFDFNTVPVSELVAAAATSEQRGVRCLLPDINQWRCFAMGAPS